MTYCKFVNISHHCFKVPTSVGNAKDISERMDYDYDDYKTPYIYRLPSVDELDKSGKYYDPPDRRDLRSVINFHKNIAKSRLQFFFLNLKVIDHMGIVLRSVFKHSNFSDF